MCANILFTSRLWLKLIWFILKATILFVAGWTPPLFITAYRSLYRLTKKRIVHVAKDCTCCMTFGGLVKIPISVFAPRETWSMAACTCCVFVNACIREECLVKGALQNCLLEADCTSVVSLLALQLGRGLAFRLPQLCKHGGLSGLEPCAWRSFAPSKIARQVRLLFGCNWTATCKYHSVTLPFGLLFDKSLFQCLSCLYFLEYVETEDTRPFREVVQSQVSAVASKLALVSNCIGNWGRGCWIQGYITMFNPCGLNAAAWVHVPSFSLCIKVT